VKKFALIMALCCGAPLHAQTASVASIECVAMKIDTLNQSESGKKLLETITPISLGDECGKEHGWTSRKSTAASLYVVAKTLQQADRVEWQSSGYAADLPDRIKKRMTLAQINEMVIHSKFSTFNRIFAEELAVTGSKLGVGGTVDGLSAAESHALGQKLGRVLFGLFMHDELPKIFDDPGYDGSDLFLLMNAISPKFADIVAKLK
jgi:hypothetical protein